VVGVFLLWKLLRRSTGHLSFLCFHCNLDRRRRNRSSALSHSLRRRNSRHRRQRNDRLRRKFFERPLDRLQLFKKERSLRSSPFHQLRDAGLPSRPAPLRIPWPVMFRELPCKEYSQHHLTCGRADRDPLSR